MRSTSPIEEILTTLFVVAGYCGLFVLEWFRATPGVGASAGFMIGFGLYLCIIPSVRWYLLLKDRRYARRRGIAEFGSDKSISNAVDSLPSLEGRNQDAADRFNRKKPGGIVAVLLISLLPVAAQASEVRDSYLGFDVTDPGALLCVFIFVLSYLFVITEEKTHLRKSKPVMMGAGLIWIIIGIAAPGYGVSHEDLRGAIFHDLDEYSSLLLFLLAAMTYISALERGNVFASLRSWLVGKGYSYRQLFWLTGGIAFFLSPIADNLTTALVMGSVVLALGRSRPEFVGIAMVNIVVAANAGGAFSPFGDITTLMVWQSGNVEFGEFFSLFLPSVVSYLIPAALMSLAIKPGAPEALDEAVTMHRGARRVIGLGILTIVMAVSFEQLLGLPPFMGMMMGLSILMFHTYYLRKTRKEGEPNYDVFEAVRSAEWDTLFFFFGVIFSVGGLGFIGYMTLASEFMYGDLGPTTTNVILGAASALIDNIPVMFSVLNMRPEMALDQWLLVTLTCGIGGSLLSMGSAAGVALMGASKGQYTFMSHLKWTPAIAAGYAAGILTYLYL